MLLPEGVFIEPLVVGVLFSTVSGISGLIGDQIEEIGGDDVVFLGRVLFIAERGGVPFSDGLELGFGRSRQVVFHTNIITENSSFVKGYFSKNELNLG